MKLKFINTILKHDFMFNTSFIDGIVPGAR